MKLWHPPAAAVFSTSQKPAGEDDPVLDKHSFTTLLEADTGLTLGPEKQEVSDLIGQHPEVFTNIPGLTQAAQLHIITGTSLPTRTNPRTVPKAWQGKVDQEIQTILDVDIIKRCYSPWTSAIVPVAKKDGTVRVSNDYRQVNKVIQPDLYPMPQIEELLDSLGKAKFISTFDMSKGYYQVPVAFNNRDKTAFMSRKGKYRFLRMPFGLKGANG